MTIQELLTETRTLLDDDIAPYNWSDSTLLKYLADGEAAFCRGTGYFVEEESFPFDTEAAKSNYGIDPRIIGIKEVWVNGVCIPKSTRQRVRGVSSASPSSWAHNAVTGKLTLYPTPTGVLSVDLTVWRKPMVRLDAPDVNYDADTPEIPEDFHQACVEYAGYRAYGKRDSEAYDPKASLTHRINFRQFVIEGKRAFDKATGNNNMTSFCNEAYVV